MAEEIKPKLFLLVVKRDGRWVVESTLVGRNLEWVIGERGSDLGERASQDIAEALKECARRNGQEQQNKAGATIAPA